MEHWSVMEPVNQIDDALATSVENADVSPLAPLVRDREAKLGDSLLAAGAIIGELIGLDMECRTPLVAYSGQPGTSALPARTVIELHHSHVGQQVVLMLDRDGIAPIIMGVLRQAGNSRRDQKTAQIEVEVDGNRVVVSGERQIVLRCGKASITLTQEGKVLIYGTYLSSHSSGVNRIKGGSVEIN